MLWVPVLLLLVNYGCSHPTHNPIDHEIEEIYKHYADYLCPHIHNVDCSQHHVHGDETVCGSDFVSYQDHCAFAVARCNDSTLVVRHKGHCDIGPLPSVNPTGVDPAYAVIKDVFCQNVHLITCGSAVTADICATDGVIYQSQCMFSKTKCFKTDIEITDATHCAQTGLEIMTTPQQ